MRQTDNPTDTGMTAETLRRRLLFQSKHRGVKELDLILGPFAERYLREFSGAELAEYAVLLCEPDPDIYDWLVGRVPLPDRLDNRVTNLLLAFKDTAPGNPGCPL
jgi:antitoxin CptB